VKVARRRQKGETHRKLREFAEQERRKERQAKRQQRGEWMRVVTSGALSNAIGTLLASGVVLLFGSLIGAIHFLDARELALIATGTTSLFLITFGTAIGLRAWRITRRIDAQVDELHEMTSNIMEQSRAREQKITEMQERGEFER